MRVRSSDSRECAANWSGVNGEGTLVILNHSSFAAYLFGWLLASSAELTRWSIEWLESCGDGECSSGRRGYCSSIHNRLTEMKDRSHDEVLAEIFRTDPRYVAALLREVQRDGCEAELKIFLRQLNRAFSRETADLALLPIENAINKS